LEGVVVDVLLADIITAEDIVGLKFLKLRFEDSGSIDIAMLPSVPYVSVKE
jgi:hypothetical protein